MSGYNSPDYIRGMNDQKILEDMASPKVFPTGPAVERDYAHELEMQKEFTQQATKLIDALKHAQKSRDEWKTYAKQLELDVVGVKALVMALRDEINHCPNHSAHPLGRNEGAQLKLHDAAYKGKAKENGLPESNWSDKVKNRAQITDNDKG